MTHRTAIRVRFSELDPYRHVNHAVYLQYLEVGRVEALEAVDASIEFMTSIGFHVVVSEISAKYHVPAVAGDDLVVETEIIEQGRASGRWSQRIMRGDELVLSATVRVATTNLEGRLRRCPPEIIERLRPLLVD